MTNEPTAADLHKAKRQRVPSIDVDKINRLPPHSIEAEQGVVGCVLIDPKWAMDELQKLGFKRQWLYHLGHQTIMERVEVLQELGRHVDVITLQDSLKKKGQLDEVGGLAYLSQLADAVPSALNISYYVEIVREKFLLRNLLRACADVEHEIHECGDVVDEAMDGFEKKLMSALSERVKAKQQPTQKERVAKALNTIEQYHENRHNGKLMGLPSGLMDLDKMTQGAMPGEMIVIAARPSVGKAQPLTSRILTPTGWVEMGDMKTGDVIIGADGFHKRVLGVFPQGVKNIYDITTTDGAVAQCCEDHLWLTSSRSERKAGRPASVKKASDIAGTVASLGRNSHSIPYCAPVQSSDAGSIAGINPWLLGIWLGDGSGGGKAQCAIFHNPEADIIARISASLPETDTVSIQESNDAAHTCPVVRVKRKKRTRKPSGFAMQLMGLGLGGRDSFNKFIPEEFLRASQFTRTELLRGLADSDGFVCGNGRGHIEISTASNALAAGIIELVRSLGGRASVQKKSNHYTIKGVRHEAAQSNRITFSFTNGVVPVSSRKHLLKYKPMARKTWRFIQSVEPAGQSECQCIAVEGGLYITDGHMVTHNTSLMTQMMEHIACDVKVPVGIFSLEMTADALTLRMLCSRARVNMRHVTDGFLAERDFPKLSSAAAQLSAAPIFIDDERGISILQLKAKARRMVQEHGVKIIGIDYCQLLSSTNKRAENRQQEIADISNGVKSLAGELGIPIYLLCQLNRDSEKEKRKPRMSDLRESGALEQDADKIALLYKDIDSDDEGADCVPVMLILAKSRNGPTGDVHLTFLKGITRFENGARGDDAGL